MNDPVQPATVYLQQARQLITDIAAAVAPGALVTQTVSDYPDSDCTAPLKGLIYYTISRHFNAPAEQTGASLIPAVIEQLHHHHGYQTGTPRTTAGWAAVTGGTNYVGLRAMGDPNSPRFRITLDTRCGTPENNNPSDTTTPSPVPSL